MPKPQDVELICWSCKITWAKIHGVWDFSLMKRLRAWQYFKKLNICVGLIYLESKRFLVGKYMLQN